MSLTVLPNLIQGTREWHDQRRGLVTASVVGKLITVRKLGAIDFDCSACGAKANEPCLSKRGSAPIKTLHSERTPSADQKTTVIEPASNDDSRALTATLADERIYGFTDPTWTNDAMWRGTIEEPLARELYSTVFAPVTEVGFMVEDKWGFKIGFSPDGLVGEDGLIEVKSRGGRKHMQTVIAGTVPIENMAQIQCGLLVSGRSWCDYVSYSSGRHLYRIRVRPDERWQKAIIAAVRLFEDNAAESIRQYTAAVEGMPVAERTPDFSDEIQVA